MENFCYVIHDNEGIHARPAGLLVKEAQKYSADIKIQKGARQADAKKLFAVMSLAAKKGEEITITIEGSDEKECAPLLQNFFKENL
jgi:phosphocarrier protein HPr